MPFPTSPVMEVNFQVSCNGRVYKNTYYWEPATTIPVGADYDAIADAWHSALVPLYAAYMSAEFTTNLTYVRYRAPGVDREGYSSGTESEGSISGAASSTETSVEIRRLTGSPGRSNRGRVFLCGIPESSTNIDYINSLNFAPYKALATYVGADRTIAGVTYHARHYNRLSNIMMPILKCTAIARLVSQRSRTKGNPFIPMT